MSIGVGRCLSLTPARHPRSIQLVCGDRVEAMDYYCRGTYQSVSINRSVDRCPNSRFSDAKRGLWRSELFAPTSQCRFPILWRWWAEKGPFEAWLWHVRMKEDGGFGIAFQSVVCMF